MLKPRIVVVIIAILAALITPRLTFQSGKAKAAEALQMIGALKRAAQGLYNLTGRCVVAHRPISWDPFTGERAGHFEELGIMDIDRSKDWQHLDNGYNAVSVKGLFG